MPYWRLSGFYLTYFAALGALVPYWSLYLKGLGFSAVEIGELMAIPMATKFIAPYVWGWLGDHLGHRMAIVRAGSLLTVLVFTSVFW
ncbi:MAG: MFS transporter, partial [Sedimenticola sp.]